MGFRTLAALVALQLGVAGLALASPTRPLSDAEGTALPQAQWFVSGADPKQPPHALNHQFYDNPAWPDLYGPGWGGVADSTAITGHIVEYMAVNGSITQFTVKAEVTNDTYDYWDVLTDTAATYGTFTAPDIVGQRLEPLFDVRISANFAGTSATGDINIYGVGYDELAFVGTSGVEPPESGPAGDFVVPTWNLGDIAPGQSASKLMTFKLQTPATSGSTLYNWITSGYDNASDLFASRTRTTRIPMYPTGTLTDDGSAWPSFGATNSCNVSVFFDEKPFVTLSRADGTPFEHYWWNGMSKGPGSMLQVKAVAGQIAQAGLTSITLKASGTGNDKNDIAAVSVYVDENWNGEIDSEDTVSGTGTYAADDGECTVAFTSPVSVSSADGALLMVAYTLANGVSPEKSYKFDVIGASAVDTDTSNAVPVFGMPFASCTKKVCAVPQAVLTIANAKKLPLGSLVMLYAKPVVGDILSNTYIEEPNGVSGIALAESTPDWSHPWYAADSFVTVVGKTGVQESDGQAVIKEPMLFDATGFTLPKPVFMSCKQVGGGSYGIQRGTMDCIASEDVDPIKSSGLNNVGMLVRVCGKVKYVGYDAMWIDDGSGLWDGCYNDFAEPVYGLQVLLPIDMIYDPTLAPQPGDCIQVTGIVTTLLQQDSELEPKPLIKAVGPRAVSDVRVLVPAFP